MVLWIRKYLACIAITVPSPLSFARFSPAVRVFSGIFSVLGTIETQSFKVSCGIWRSSFGELSDVDTGTTAIIAERASPDVPIKVALDLRECRCYVDKACFVQLLGNWPKAILAKLCEVNSNSRQVIASSIIDLAIVFIRRRAVMFE